jgi:hypothetical protein
MCIHNVQIMVEVSVPIVRCVHLAMLTHGVSGADIVIVSSALLLHVHMLCIPM